MNDVKVPGEIEHQRFTDRLARKACPGATRQEWYAKLMAGFYDR